MIELVKVIREGNELHLVFECMDCNLYRFLLSRTCLIPKPEVLRIMIQVLSGVAYIHASGYIHRDLKPENILVSTGLCVKIADFGLARLASSSVTSPLTEYISTRWYRAPECLLRSTSYSFPIDLWAVGVIWAEVVSLRPLFPGKSEMDQLHRICGLLGPPTDWPDGLRMASALGFKFPSSSRARESGCEEFNDFLQWDALKRISAAAMLERLQGTAVGSRRPSDDLDTFIDSLDDPPTQPFDVDAFLDSLVPPEVPIQPLPRRRRRRLLPKCFSYPPGSHVRTVHDA